MELTDFQFHDLEMLSNGGFSPLVGFLEEADYLSVVQNMRLSNGALWPMPICLDIIDEFQYYIGESIVLSYKGIDLAVLNITSIYKARKDLEKELVFGTFDNGHPSVARLNQLGDYYIGGPISVLNRYPFEDFKELRLDPFQTRELPSFVAFQTRNPMHRAHLELTLKAANESNSALLIHPVAGITKPGDIEYPKRVRSYLSLLSYYPKDLNVTISLLPLAMRMAGPREALWHALIRQNYGASYFIIGRDHAGCSDSTGKSVYEPYAAHDLVKQFEHELNIKILFYKQIYYSNGEYNENENVNMISGTELRRLLRNKEEIPEWVSFPEVLDAIKD